MGSFPALASPRPAATRSPSLGPGPGLSRVSSNAPIKTHAQVACPLFSDEKWVESARQDSSARDGGVRGGPTSPSRSREGRTPFRRWISGGSFAGPRRAPRRPPGGLGGTSRCAEPAATQGPFLPRAARPFAGLALPLRPPGTQGSRRPHLQARAVVAAAQHGGRGGARGARAEAPLAAWTDARSVIVRSGDLTFP